MISNPMISVIIPTYNRAFCVGDAIRSVLSQTYHDFELIVVDDGSTDNTAEVLAEFGNQIQVIRQENSGVSAARNAGIRAARGEWIAFLDSDDVWEPDKLKVQMEDIGNHAEVVAHMVDGVITDLPGGDVSLFEVRGMHEEFEKRPLRTRPLGDVVKTPFLIQCCVIRKRVLETVGCFDGLLAIYEDLNLLARVALEGAFYINTFVGARIRRRSGDVAALSELHQTQRLRSLASLIKTYTYLAGEPRLSDEERKMVCRYLGGTWCEIMAEHLKNRKLREAASAFLSSIKNDLGPRAVLRALFWTLHGTSLFRQISNLKHGPVLRRSELIGDSHLERRFK